MNEYYLKTSEDKNYNFGETMTIFQPKLLRMKKTNSVALPSKTYHEEKTRKNNKLNREEKPKLDKKEKKELDDQMLSFYKNPFQFMDYLIEKYFQKNSEKSFNQSDAIQLVFKEFESLGNKTKAEISKFIDTHIERLKQEESNKNTCCRKSERKKIKTIENTESITVDKNELEAEEIKSEPVDQEELLSALKDDFNSNKFMSIINTKSDVKNYLLNDKYSALNKESLLRKTLDCIKGEKIEIPKNDFLKVNDLNINDINEVEMQYTKNILDMQRQFDHIKEKTDNIIIEQIGKTAEKEQDIFKTLIEKSNNSVSKMEKGSKISEEMFAHIQQKLNDEFNKDIIKLGIQQLKLRETNLDKIKEDINNNEFCKEDQNIARALERVKLIEENNKKAEEEIKRFLKKEGLETEEEFDQGGVDTEMSERTIDQLYNKFKKQDKKKTKFDSNPINNNKKKVIRQTTNMSNLKYK